MPRRIAFTFLLLAVGIVIGVMLRPNIAADPPKEEKKEKPIPIDEVRKRGVLGDLGHPLGTIVTVEGEATDGKETGAKGDDGQTLLRVKSINSVELKPEVVFHFNGAEADKPKVGTKFKYTGYETGGYDGGVVGEFKYKPLMSGVGYGFHTNFRILKNELKPEKK